MKDDPPPAISRASLADEAYTVIRGWILAGRIPPGGRVTVRPIADELGLSHTPVNAALAALSRDGVLESRLHRGYFVPQFDIEDLREIYEVREGLDLVAVRRLCIGDHRAIGGQLAEYCDRQQAFLDESDIDGYRAEDLAFHQAIWKLSGNRRLGRVGANLQDQMRLGNAVSARRPGRGAEALGEHRDIVSAITGGDLGAAEHAVRRHLRRTAANFAEQVDENDLAAPQR